MNGNTKVWVIRVDGGFDQIVYTEAQRRLELRTLGGFYKDSAVTAHKMTLDEAQKEESPYCSLWNAMAYVIRVRNGQYLAAPQFSLPYTSDIHEAFAFGTRREARALMIPGAGERLVVVVPKEEEEEEKA